MNGTYTGDNIFDDEPSGDAAAPSDVDLSDVAERLEDAADRLEQAAERIEKSTESDASDSSDG